MCEVFSKTDQSYLQIDKWQQINSRLKAGFTTRIGGLSDPPYDTLNLGIHTPDDHETVILNREKLSDKLSIPLTNWISGEQTHETNIKIVTHLDKGKGATSYQSALKGIDGLITSEEGILCTAYFADCVPLYFFDPHSGYIGIAHAGWKGTVNKIAKEMVDKLISIGVKHQNLLVVIGPCISQAKYEVDKFVFNRININNRDKFVINNDNERFLLDLKQLNVEILLQAGVLRNNIDITNYCTFTNKDLFYSHRRDDGKTGRMLGYLGYSDRK